MLKVEYEKNVPLEVQRAVRKHLRRWMIPKWVHRVTFIWCDSLTDNAASTMTYYEYRRLEVRLHAGFFDRPREYLIHELLHGFLCPVSDFARLAFQDIFAEDSAKCKIINRQFVEHVESVIEDLRVLLEEQHGDH